MPNTTDVVSSNPAQARCRTLRDKVCQWLAAGRWFSPGTPVSSTNKTDRHDITEIFLKVALNTIKPKAWNTLCKIKEFFKPTVLTLLHVRLRILLTRGKHLHYRIIWISGEVYIDKTSQTPPLLIACTKPDKREVMYMCIEIVSVYNLLIGLWNCSDSVAFYFFIVWSLYMLITNILLFGDETYENVKYVRLCLHRFLLLGIRYQASYLC